MKLFNLLIPLSTAVNIECHHGQGSPDAIYRAACQYQIDGKALIKMRDDKGLV